MIFALTSLSLSAIIVFFYNLLSGSWLLYISLIFKGVGGNVTPVALASLATIVPHRKFTFYLAIAICAYSLGMWVPIYLHSFHYLSTLAAFLALVCTIIIIKWFKESEFDDFKLKNNTASLGNFFLFLKKDVISIARFAVAVSVMLALFGYLSSEVAYYQVLLRGEILGESIFYSNLSLKMGLSYYVGTLLLYLLLRRKVSSMRCLLLGVLSALFSIIVSSILSSIGMGNKLLFDILFSFFSIGFALLTPSLFSELSRIRRKDEQGKIYGFLDTFDTLAAYLSVKYIGIAKDVAFNRVLWPSFVLLFIGAVFIFSFIRDIKERSINHIN